MRLAHSIKRALAGFVPQSRPGENQTSALSSFPSTEAKTSPALQVEPTFSSCDAPDPRLYELVAELPALENAMIEYEQLLTTLMIVAAVQQKTREWQDVDQTCVQLRSCSVLIRLERDPLTRNVPWVWSAHAAVSSSNRRACGSSICFEPTGQFSNVTHVGMQLSSCNVICCG